MIYPSTNICRAGSKRHCDSSVSEHDDVPAPLEKIIKGAKAAVEVDILASSTNASMKIVAVMVSTCGFGGETSRIDQDYFRISSSARPGIVSCI